MICQQSLSFRKFLPRLSSFINTIARFLLVIFILSGLFLQVKPAAADGGAYSITFTAADPRENNGPYDPTYERVAPAAKDCPTPGGRAINPLVDAVYADPAPPNAVDAVTSMAPGDMILGQIVPFEIVVEVNGDTTPEDGVIQFAAEWSTVTTPGDDFGYDTTYGVYCAFVDIGDAYTDDPGNDATVDWFSDSLLGTNIYGEFQVSGLDDGDEVVVEVWMVLDSEFPEKATGNVASGMDSAQTVAPEPDTINVGAQTVPLQKVSDFINITADLSVVKIDVPNTPMMRNDIFDYIVYVTNTSPEYVSNGVVITDTLDIHTQFLSVDVIDPGGFGRNCVDPLTPNNGEVYCDLKGILPQETVPVSITVRILETAPVGSMIETPDCTYGDHATFDICNRVDLASTVTIDENQENNFDTEPKDVLAAADLGLIVICPNSPIVPESEVQTTSANAVLADFHVRVTNYGPDLSHGVVLTDTLPERTSLIGYTTNYTATETSTDPLVLALDYPLPVLETWYLTITLDVSDVISYNTVTITNTAVVTSSTPEPEGATAPNSDSCEVTPVNLTYFYARTEDGRILCDWQTALETGNLGFNILLKTEQGMQKLNESLIPSEALYSTQGSKYQYEAGYQPGELIYLETVDAVGGSRLHGPFVMGQPFGLETKPIPTGWIAIQSEHNKKSALRQQNIPINAQPLVIESPNLTPRLFIPVVGMNYVKTVLRPATFEPIDLTVEQDGLYRITYEELLNEGISLKGADPKAIAILNHGASVPVKVVSDEQFGPGSYLEFYGRAENSLYTRANIYTIFNQKSLATTAASEDGQPLNGNQVVSSYISVLDINQNLAYSMGSPSNDPWFERDIRASNAPAYKEFELWVRDYAQTGAPELRVNLWGMTDQPASGDHHVVILLNGVEVYEEIFDGILVKEIDASIPAGVLQEGKNIMRVLLPGDTGVESVIAVDRYALSYLRNFTAVDGTIAFSSSGEVFEIDGFTSPDVKIYRIYPDYAEIVGAQIVASGGGYQVRMAGSPNKAHYLLTEASKLKKPVSMRYVNDAGDLLSGEADLLIISHPDFIDVLQPLVDARQSEGLRVKSVSVEDVYAQYSHKIVDPRAIQEYVREAVKEMGVEYLLLVGGDTYDYLDYSGHGSISFIPSLYASTHTFVRHSPVDALFGDINGDQRPEIPVGRFPVRSSAEVKALVAKTLAYGQKTYQETAILAADQNDGTLSFAQQSESLYQPFPAGWDITTAYLKGDVNFTEVRQALINGINAGKALINYIGHSSDQQWSEKGLFTKDDALNLVNTNQPTIFNQLACWNNYILWPDQDTLAHVLLVYNNAGGAAMIGSVTLTSEDVHETFGEQLVPYLMQPGIRIGQALMEAGNITRTTHPDLAASLNGYSILGDPTLIIQP